MVLLFCYGTLKRDEVNYPHWLSNSRDAHFITKASTVQRYPLFCNPPALHCSPCLLDSPNLGHRVNGEVFDVAEEHVVILDELEGVREGVYKIGVIQVNPAGSDVVLDVKVYFRASLYPSNWAESAKLLREFTVADCVLSVKGYACLPAHLNPAFGAIRPPYRPPPMVLVIIDGIGDVTYPVTAFLNGAAPCGTETEIKMRMDEEGVGSKEVMTPLEYAATRCPALNLITQHGVSGLMDPYSAGAACGSDTAHMSMFGYDPAVYYRGRGAFESIGAGLDMDPGDIAFKSNFSVVNEETNVVTHRRCDRHFTDEGPVLCQALDGLVVTHDVSGVPFPVSHTVRVKYATEHRCGVVIKTVQGQLLLSDLISGTDPLADGRPLVQCSPTTRKVLSSDELACAQYTCRVVMAVSAAISNILRNHPVNKIRVDSGKLPANIVLLRGAAMNAVSPSFLQMHGLRSGMVAPTCIIRGLGKTIGMDIIESDGGTGDYNSNLLNKSIAILQAIPKYEFLVLHIKGVDDAGHDRSLSKKVEMLLRAGEALELLWNQCPVGTTVAVTGDHSTPVLLGDHSCEPVPVSIAKKTACGSQPRDGLTKFSEIECVAGSLGRFVGMNLVPTMKRLNFASSS